MTKRILSVALGLISALCLSAQTVESNLVDAVSLYSNGEYARAQKILQTLSVAAPDNDAVWYYLSQTQIHQGNLAEAQTSLEKAAALDSTNYWYREILARMYLVNGQTEKGTALYEGLVKDFPDKSGLPYELLDLYLKSKEFDKALGALEEIERQRGLSEEVATTRFNIYNAMGRPDLAESTLEAFNAEYSSPMVLTMLGDAYLADFSDSLARARYTEALDLDGSYIPALLGLSEVHRHQRQYKEYFQTLQPFFASPDVPAATKGMYLASITRSIDPKMLQLHRQGFDSLAVTAASAHPADTALLSTVGSYYYSTGRVEESGKWFKAAADAGPESVSLNATYIQYLSITQQWEVMRERSLEAFQRFHELGFMDYANMANYQLKDYDAIIGNSRFLITHYPKDNKVLLSAWSQLGDAYYSKGNNKEAYKAYEKALKIDPSYSIVLNNYAYYLSLEGKKLKKAYAMSKKTVEAEPDNATYLDTFGWILHLMGKDLEAKPFFKHAMLYGGKDSAVVLEHYAVVLEALGEADTAKVYRNMAKRLDKTDE
ncbi:MAG: tetratricopeptide repeat protein [Bacteroidales bacterium]|nr:tetratricopeptide repeat protein [Bacteroidales bacterium]